MEALCLSCSPFSTPLFCVPVCTLLLPKLPFIQMQEVDDSFFLDEDELPDGRSVAWTGTDGGSIGRSTRSKEPTEPTAEENAALLTLTARANNEKLPAQAFGGVARDHTQPEPSTRTPTPTPLP